MTAYKGSLIFRTLLGYELLEALGVPLGTFIPREKLVTSKIAALERNLIRISQRAHF